MEKRLHFGKVTFEGEQLKCLMEIINKHERISRRKILEEFGEVLQKQDIFDTQEKMIENIIAWRIEELEKLKDIPNGLGTLN